MSDAFVRAYPPAIPATSTSVRLLFAGDKIVVVKRSDGVALATDSDVRMLLADDALLYLGTMNGVAVETGELVEDAAVVEPLATMTLRELFGLVSDDEYALAGYASQMLHWCRTSRFCPVCGTATADREGDWGRLCPHCGHISYPHVTPATLILVHDGGDRILLGHKPGWGDRYSILAGFVEPGESLEECVRRETMEEAGLVIDELEYAGSQPWPYPHQLMIGFNVLCTSGQVRFDGIELDDAQWFTRDNLPGLPPPVSLSRRMIDAWLAHLPVLRGKVGRKGVGSADRPTRS